MSEWPASCLAPPRRVLQEGQDGRDLVAVADGTAAVGIPLAAER